MPELTLKIQLSDVQHQALEGLAQRERRTPKAQAEHMAEQLVRRALDALNHGPRAGQATAPREPSA